MPKGTISIAVMIIGLLMLMASFFFNPAEHSESAWSPEQAKKHAELGAQVHAQSFDRDPLESGGTSAPPDTEELAETRKQWEASQADLEAARSGRANYARILLISGIVITAGGVVANRVGY